MRKHVNEWSDWHVVEVVGGLAACRSRSDSSAGGHQRVRHRDTLGVVAELLDVVLVAPEIAPNTGNIIRLCANTGAVLHLVEPLGFSIDDRSLRRAGLDYHELADVRVHRDLSSCRAQLDGVRWFACSARATRRYDEVVYASGDAVVFGAERAGLPADVLASFEGAHVLGIPMREGNRSLNLANAVAVVVYEAWRQRGFSGGALGGQTTTSETLGAGPSI
jgi:tRNA (cytidine/uridine-2'-O-)-methyltransferase